MAHITQEPTVEARPFWRKNIGHQTDFDYVRDRLIIRKGTDMHSLRQTITIVGLALSSMGCAAQAATAHCSEPMAQVAPKLASEAEMNAEHEKLVAAYRKNDVATLEKLLSADHVHNNVFGMKQDKQTLLEDIRSGTLVFQAYDVTASQWMIQPELAIVTGTIHADATRAGKPVPTHEFRFTRIFVKRDGNWLEWLFQNTMIATPPKQP